MLHCRGQRHGLALPQGLWGHHPGRHTGSVGQRQAQSARDATGGAAPGMPAPSWSKLRLTLVCHLGKLIMLSSLRQPAASAPQGSAPGALRQEVDAMRHHSVNDQQLETRNWGAGALFLGQSQEHAALQMYCEHKRFRGVSRSPWSLTWNSHAPIPVAELEV